MAATYALFFLPVLDLTAVFLGLSAASVYYFREIKQSTADIAIGPFLKYPAVCHLEFYHQSIATIWRYFSTLLGPTKINAARRVPFLDRGVCSVDNID